MPDQNDFDVAIDTVTIGMLANDALLAAVRYIPGEILSERDKRSFRRAHDLLTALSDLAGKDVLTSRASRAARAVGPVDEAVQANGRSKGTPADFVEMINQLVEAIGSMIDSSADAKVRNELRSFFEHLGAVTRSRTEEMVSPGERRQTVWTETLLPS